MICKKETKVLISKKNILTERIKGKSEKKKKKKSSRGFVIYTGKTKTA